MAASLKTKKCARACENLVSQKHHEVVAFAFAAAFVVVLAFVVAVQQLGDFGVGVGDCDDDNGVAAAAAGGGGGGGAVAERSCEPSAHRHRFAQPRCLLLH